MAPYGVCEVVQSPVRSCSVTSKVGQNWAQSILTSKARHKQCSDFEGKINQSELSTLNSDFGVSAELSTVDCDVERSFTGMQCFGRTRSKSELSTVNDDFKCSTALMASDSSPSAIFASVATLNLWIGATFSKINLSDLSRGAVFPKVVFFNLSTGALL